jgi:hypothetical protein
MVSEFVFIIIVVLRVTPVLFNVVETESLHILLTCIGTALHGANLSFSFTFSPVSHHQDTKRWPKTLPSLVHL